jgi:endo-1,4-beta-xylanase
MRILLFLLFAVSSCFALAPNGVVRYQTITINSSSVSETNSHFLYQVKIPRTGDVLANCTSSTNVVVYKAISDTTKYPKWVVYTTDTLFLYADLAVSSTENKTYVVGFGKAVNTVNSSSTFTNCGVANFWGLNEATNGSTSADYTSKSNLTVAGSATIGNTGFFGKAASPANGQIYTPDTVSKMITQVYDVYVKMPSSVYTNTRIFQERFADNCFVDTRLNFYGGAAGAMGPVVARDGAWRHVSVIKTSAGVITMLLDGVVVYGPTFVSALRATDGTGFYVGSSADNNFANLDRIDELVVFNTAISSAYLQSRHTMMATPATFSTLGTVRNALAIDTLQKASQSAGVTLGCLVSRSVAAAKDYKYLDFIDTTFDRATIGLNMVNTWTARNTYNWNWTDSSLAVTMAMTNKKRIHINTLVWSNYVPTWISTGGYSSDTVKVLLNEYITATLQHVRGIVGSTYTVEYDVINEDLNTTNWWKTNVTDYMDYCFRAARAADPAAILYYNEFAMETTGDRLNKANRFYKSLVDLKALGTPIDMIGFQSHFASDTGSVTRMSGVIKQINRVKALGYNVAITEIDWRMALIADSSVMYELQARKVGAYIEQILKAGVKDITFWGFDDSTSASITAGYGVPTMCKKWNGTSFEKKPFYYAVLAALTNVNTGTRERNVINIRVNKRAVASVVDSFPLTYDLRNAGTSFWSACKDDGSDIYITDSAGNVKNSYLSGFSKTKKLGLLHFVSKVDTTGNRLLKVRYGDKTHTTTKSALAFTNAAVVNCFDMSKTTGDMITDMAGNTNLPITNSAAMTVIDTAPLGNGIRSYNSHAYNSVATYPLSNLTTGSIEVQYYGDSSSANAGYLFNIAQSGDANRIGVYQANVSNKATQYTYITQASSTAYLSTYDSSTFDSSWHYSMITWNGTGCYPYVDNRSEKGRLADRTISFTGNAYYTLFTNTGRQTAAYYKGTISFVAVHSSPRDENYRSTRLNLLNDNSNFWITTEPIVIKSGNIWSRNRNRSHNR